MNKAHNLAAARALVISSADNRHGSELAEEASKLMRHDPEDTFISRGCLVVVVFKVNWRSRSMCSVIGKEYQSRK